MRYLMTCPFDAYSTPAFHWQRTRFPFVWWQSLIAKVVCQPVRAWKTSSGAFASQRR